VILGNSGVGKTTVLGRWMDNQFTITSATISVEFSNKSFKVDDKLIKVQLWDTGTHPIHQSTNSLAGQEKFRALTQNYYRNAVGAILVYDITSLDSFTNLDGWLDALRNAQGNERVKIMLIGNKADLHFQRKVYFSNDSCSRRMGVHW
jgi:small GTP-binding protein